MRPPLVLPRPNLGPEPWVEPGLPAWMPVATALVLFLAVLALAWSHRRRRATPPDPIRTLESLASEARADADAGPDRLIERAAKAREALAGAFGPEWRARTTEEVAADEGLAERLGAEILGGLAALLREADRAKFSADQRRPA